ncbi:MAG: hypothetical protein K0U66_03920 [Gammaproteobacteria bacterium]|nr:hypothetical protein [Gammaproteobacteria bacterium]
MFDTSPHQYRRKTAIIVAGWVLLCVPLLATGEVYGDFSTRFESRSTLYPRAYDSSYGYYKYIYGQAYFRNDERPGWYGGFVLIQERARGIDPDTRGGDNDIISGYFGKFFERHWGHIGAETGLGQESRTGIKLRPRFYLRYDFNASYHFIADIAYNYLGDQSSEFVINKEAHELELATALHYRRRANYGMYVKSYWRPRVQIRSQFGNIIEEELFLSYGVWRHFRRWQTSAWLELGGVRIFNNQGGEIFNNYTKSLLGTRLDYLINDDLRLSARISYERQWNKRGLWVPNGSSAADEISFDIGVSYTF